MKKTLIGLIFYALTALSLVWFLLRVLIIPVIGLYYDYGLWAAVGFVSAIGIIAYCYIRLAIAHINDCWLK